MMKMKYLNKLNERLDYSNIESDGYTDDNMKNDITDSYVNEIERGTKSKVLSVEGEVTESDSYIELSMDNGDTINLEYLYHPFSPKLTLSVFSEDGGKIGEKSYGTFSGNKDDSKYYDDVENDVYNMVKDIYDEFYQHPTHYISFPEESSNTFTHRYFFKNNPVNGGEVTFPSKEAAEEWLNSLKIRISEDY